MAMEGSNVQILYTLITFIAVIAVFVAWIMNLMIKRRRARQLISKEEAQHQYTICLGLMVISFIIITICGFLSKH